MRRLLAALAALVALSCGAHAQVTAPTQCGPVSIGVVAAPIVYPVSGGHGPSVPNHYVMIVNPNAAGSLWINATGGTAAAATAGSFPLVGQGNSVVLPGVKPISIIGSAGGMAVTCLYQ